MYSVEQKNLWEAYQSIYEPQELTEEVEEWVNSLLDEGYNLSDYTWDDMIEMYMSEAVNPSTRQELGRVASTSTSAGRNASGFYPRGTVEVKAPRGGKPGTVIKRNGVVDPKSWQPTYSKPTPVGGGMSAYNESFDLFDTILEYLVSEGYADSAENALVIMANMSEEWRRSIVEQVVTTTGQVNPPIKPGPIFPGRPFMGANRPYQDPWINPNGATGARAPQASSRKIKKDTAVA